MNRTMTSFEAFELEIWGLRSAHDRHRAVPVLLNFAIRQRSHSLADAVEATLQIYRRYQDRYRRDAESTSKRSLLVSEVEAYSNGLRIDDRDARVVLPDRDGNDETYVVDSDLYYIDNDGSAQFPRRSSDLTEDAAPSVSEAWARAVERVATIGMSVGYFSAGRVADRSGAFTCRIRGGAPGLGPASPLTESNAWYDVRLHEGLTDAERLAVLAEILGYIFLGFAPQVWLGDGAWTNRDSLVPNTPATSHWWIAPESRTGAGQNPSDDAGGVRAPLLTATSRSFTDMEAQQAMLAGMIGVARAGLLPHLPTGRRLGSPGQVTKSIRWVKVLDAAVRIEELFNGSMSAPQAAPPSGRIRSGFDEA